MYAAIAALGRSGVAELVDRLCDRAALFAELLRRGGAEILVEPVLNQVLVSFGDDNDAVIDVIQASGELWAGATTWQGTRAMRLSVSGWATSEADVERSTATILAAWRSLAS